MIATHYLVDLGLPHDAEVVVCGDRLLSITPPQPEQITAIVAASAAGEFDDVPDVMRAIRGRLLSACDWTQAADSPLTPEQRAAWATYRQALRDLPANYGGDGPIPWPVAPG